MSSWKDEDIQKIIFTDESKLFCQKQGIHFVRVLKGSKIPHKYFRKTSQNHGGLELMVWGSIGFEGGQRLIRINERLNGESYKKILDENLIETGLIDDRILQQDNAAVHSSKAVKQYLESEGIELLNWPSQSPDMSPIENVWAWVKNQLEINKNKIQNQDQLWRQAQTAFFSEACTNLIRHMYLNYQNRINELIKNAGKSTKY
ncbi:hypothetical protein ABPG72_018363 [Tetrahymena utriculariae]